MDRFGIRDTLRELGWGKSMASCYWALVQYGEMKASEVANHAGLRQEKVYNPLTRLENRGYVVITDTGPKRYRAQNPRFVIEQERKQFEEQTDSILEDLEEAWARSSVGNPKTEDYAHVLSGQGGFRTGRSDIIDKATDSLYIADSQFMMISPDDRDEIESLLTGGTEVRILAPSSEVLSYMSDVGADVRYPENNDYPSYYIANENTVMLNVANRRATVIFEDSHFAGIITSEFEDQYQAAPIPDHET